MKRIKIWNESKLAATESTKEQKTCFLNEKPLFVNTKV